MANKLWGGRFKKEIDEDFFKFQKSIGDDYRLAEYDVYHSGIHIGALQKQGILDKKEAGKLFIALSEILDEIKKGRFKVDPNSEDIHTEIQNRIEKKLGRVALKLHSLRSRNDQIVFDEKLYCVEKALDIGGKLLDLRESLFNLAMKYKRQIFIGYTHTQKAQAVLFKFYLLAFYYMFQRDFGRLKRFYENVTIYIGAGALTGSALTRPNYNEAIKEYPAQGVLKGYKIEPSKNALDDISDRDFIIEFLSIISIIQMHLSRMAEDFILYSTKELNYIELPEEFCTGSSLMPHKKNPDFLELVRGNTGIIYGNLMSILTTMKGLPLTYNRDMQLDKKPLFSSVDTIGSELKIMAKFIKGIKLNKAMIEKSLEDKTLYATELAEWLVIKKKVPFKHAHDIAGRLTILIEKSGGDIDKISDKELKKLHGALNKNIIKKIMNPKHAISSKKTFSRRIPKR